MLALGVGIDGGTGGLNANLKVTGGLTKMGEYTKLKISFDLAKDPESTMIPSTYIRLRATGTSDTINFFETVSEGSCIKFYGKTLSAHTITETMKNYTFIFDFAAGTVSLSIDGTLIDTVPVSIPSGSKVTSLADWPATTKASGFIFNWGSRAGATQKRGLLFDNLSVVTITE